LDVLERSPQPPEARGLGAKPPALGDFSLQFFNKNNAFFEAITHQLKAFEKQSKRTKQDK